MSLLLRVVTGSCTEKRKVIFFMNINEQTASRNLCVFSFVKSAVFFLGIDCPSRGCIYTSVVTVQVLCILFFFSPSSKLSPALHYLCLKSSWDIQPNSCNRILSVSEECGPA